MDVGTRRRIAGQEICSEQLMHPTDTSLANKKNSLFFQHSPTGFTPDLEF
jgi:hypothetical protein